MALQFKNGIFFHIPKTGGNYTRRVIRSLIPKGQGKEIGGSPHCDPVEANTINPETGRTNPHFWTFCIVRHPVEWYCSVYRYRRQTGPRFDWDLDPYLQHKVFNDFVDLTCNAYPNGFLTSWYKRFTPYVNTVLRTEMLTNGLKANLKKAGIIYNPGSIDKIPRTNVSDRQYKTQINISTLQKLYKAEKSAFKDYGYPRPF